MRNVAIICLLLALLFASCKKNSPTGCGYCTDLNKNVIWQGFDDSALMMQRLQGTWYLRQQNTNILSNNCQHTCYPDSVYPFTFLSNKKLVVTLPDQPVDTSHYGDFVGGSMVNIIFNGDSTAYLLYDSVRLRIITDVTRPEQTFETPCNFILTR